MNSQTHDVVVVGARCAGSAVAIPLARQGLRVLVLDRAAYGSDTVSTHALMRGGVLHLRELGVLDDIIAAGTPPVRRVVFHYPDDTTRITLKPAAGVDALYAPHRTVLDRILADAASAAGAEVRFSTTVTGLVHDESGRVTGVLAQDRHGRRYTARGRLIVGADGVGSIVADAVGAPLTWKASGQGSAFLYSYWEDLPVEGYEWFYSPGSSAGLIPTNDGRTGVFVGTTRERMKVIRSDGTWPGFRALLDIVASGLRERLEAARAPSRLRGFAGVGGYLRQAWGPGWALVGDAGGFEDPLSTHGITDALRDATLLAGAVSEIHGGTRTEAEALADYQSARDDLALPLMSVIDTISAYGWSMSELRRLLLDASSAMSGQVEVLNGGGHPAPPAARR